MLWTMALFPEPFGPWMKTYRVGIEPSATVKVASASMVLMLLRILMLVS